MHQRIDERIVVYIGGQRDRRTDGRTNERRNDCLDESNEGLVVDAGIQTDGQTDGQRKRHA